MEEEKRKKLIEKIINEQDLVSFYVFNDFNESLSILQEYSYGVYYSGIRKFIFENPEIMDKFSVKNLYTLLTATFRKDEDEIELVNSKIAKKLENENFFCEDLTKDVFMRTLHTNNLYKKISEENRKNIGDKILEELKVAEESECGEIAKNIKNYPSASNFLKYYNQGIFTPEKIEAISEIVKKDPDSLRYMNFGLYQDEIFEIGADFCEYIAKFPNIGYQLLLINDNAPQMFKTISERITTYDDIKDNLKELEVLITYGARNVFELQNEEINFDEFLECAYRNSNKFNLINVSYGKDYQKRLQEKLSTEYEKSTTVEKKLNVYMNKVYSLTLENAKALLKDFGSDLDNLENISEETKKFFGLLEEVVELENQEEIDMLFNSEQVRYSATEIQKIKGEIQKECAREFSTEFRNTDEKIQEQLQKNQDVTQIEYNGSIINQVKLNGKFNLLLHSTDTEFISKKEKPEDFKQCWCNTNQNHIVSTTYVNQDFLGTAPLGANGVRYAFSTIQNKNIRLMGVTDLNTYTNNFAYDSAKRQYMSANTLAYNSRRVYSEFGVEKQELLPDYIVVLDDDLPEAVENSYKAATQFNVPVLYIDKPEIEQQQLNTLDELLKNFSTTHDTDTLQRLINTYETNMSGWLLNRSEDISMDESYTAGINNERFKQDFKDVQLKIEQTISEYMEAQKENEHSDKEISTIIKILLKEIELYKGCEERKPISKTKISFDATQLLKNANSTLEAIGKSELMVDTNKLPTSKEYNIKIQQLVKNALKGENAVSTEDIQYAEEFLKDANERNTEEKLERE